MINNNNYGDPKNLEFIGVQNNEKMSLEHFVKHLICNTTLSTWAMHEHMKNMPKYKFKLPQGANTDTNKTNGTNPNQNFENFFAQNQ